MTELADRAVGANQLLPPSTYFERDWFDREQAELFGRTWRYVGPAADLERPGSYRSMQVGPHPLVVVCGADGRLRAFHNVCRHRGTAVLPDERGRVDRQIVCPFHHWTYGLDGCLLGVSQRNEVGKDIDRSALGLHPAAVDVWRGLVFVHPDPDAEPLLDWLGEIPAAVGPFDIAPLVPLGPTDVNHVRSNWKVVVEGALDNYHLGYVHAKNLAGYDHVRQEQRPCAPRHWFFYEPPVIAGELSPADRRDRLEPISDDPHWYGASFGFIFPNLFVLTLAAIHSVAEVVPVGPEQARIELTSYVRPGQNVRLAKAYMRLRAEAVAERIRHAVNDVGASVRAGDRDVTSLRAALRKGKRYSVVEEDVFCAESVQRGLRSPRFSVGPIATRYERGIQEFQRNVRDYVPTDGEARS